MPSSHGPQESVQNNLPQEVDSQSLGTFTVSVHPVITPIRVCVFATPLHVSNGHPVDHGCLSKEKEKEEEEEEERERERERESPSTIFFVVKL